MQSLRRSITFSIGVAASVVFILSACTTAPSIELGDSPPQEGEVGTSAKVATGSITPIITLEGEVRAPVDFQITADFDGTVRLDDANTMKILDQNGKAQKITDLPDVTYVPIQAEGSRVKKGLPLAQAQYSSFALVAPITGADLLRMIDVPKGVRAQISGLGAPFVCNLLDDRPSSGSVDASGQERFVACAIPDDQTVISGLRGLIAIQFESRVDVLVLPVEAVAGTLDSGSVYVEENGQRVEKQVELGASDGHNIEIVSGLDEGQEVLFPSPSLYK